MIINVYIKWLLLSTLVAIILLAIYRYDKHPAVGSVPDNLPVLDIKSLSCEGCNLLLLNIELLRADYVGLLNSEKISNTPNIDNFFKNAILFSDISAPAGETYRSNLATLTSKEAFYFPVTEKRIHQYIYRKKNTPTPEKFIDIEEMLLKFPTLAEHLKSNQYHTISMNQGIRAGKRLMLDRGFDNAINWDRRKVSYRQTIDVLLDNLKNNKESPYFLLYRPEALHPMPYHYPADLDRIEDPERIINQHKPQFSRFNIRVNHAISKPEIRRTLHELYAQQVRMVDSELNEIFTYLKEYNRLANTIVVLYSNHGSGLGDNGVEKLAVSYQSCIRVPLLIRHPAVTHKIQINTPVTLLDLMPTLLELTGHSVPDQIDGESLLRDYNQEAGKMRPIIGRNDFDEYIRVGDYKLIRKQGNRVELYLLTTDPGEIRSIADDDPERVRKMLGILETTKTNMLKNQYENVPTEKASTVH